LRTEVDVLNNLADEEEARGRLRNGSPLAVIDIGSNSVRLVVYDGLTRSPTAIFNEKVLCGLGRAVATTGRLTSGAVTRALSALRRFRALCDVMKVGEVRVLATAAARDAANGREFLDAARAICRADIELLSGKREAHLSALGVVSGFWKPDGLVGDLGGGSLELVQVSGHEIGSGVTLPLGGLALEDVSSGSLKKADKIVKSAIGSVPGMKSLEQRDFYAVGGTWRALVRLHMAQKHYPLRVMHAYTVPAKEALALCQRVRRVDPDTLPGISSVSNERRPLLAYGALVLEHIIKTMKPRNVVISALGVREGLLYELLDEDVRKEDPLIEAAAELSLLRSRSPRHGYELIDWTDAFIESAGVNEDDNDRRLRHAACHLADIGWRAHPDYRGEQGFNIIANAAFIGVDHPGRAYLALAIYFRHEGLRDEGISPSLKALASPRILERARLLGAAMRVAYLVSASMPGVLPRTGLSMEKERLVLRLPMDLQDLAGDRLANRVRQMARLIGKEPQVDIV
jgi:exopolyphosphatase / guanosine-5'-triphosphate,3'-diphosphate pyrophosphatase